MKYKRLIPSVAMTALLLLSVPAYAAEYSVHDDEVRSTLSDIKGQIQTIQQYLDVIKEKELSMDLLNKAAAERTNDSMTKLTPTNDMSFVSTNDNSTDWSALTRGGSGRFLEAFEKDMAKDGFNLSEFAKNTKICSVPVDEFMEQFSGITSGSNFDGLTDIDSIKTVYVQNLQELSAAKLEIDEEVAEYDKKKKEIDDKDNKRMEDIAKAEDSKSDEHMGTWNKIGSYGDLLGGKYGAKLDPTSLHTIFMKEGTESTTAAQERTTSVDMVRTNKEIRDTEQRAVHMQANIKKNQIDICIAQNDAQLIIAFGKADSASIRSLPVGKGKKHKYVFDD